MSSVGILFTAIAAAVIYGVLHDMITAHLCLEYFTVGRPRLFSSNVPALHALGWGVIATWWVGAILGLPLVLSARLGRSTPFTPRDLVRPLVVLLLVMGACAFLAGATMWVAQEAGFAHPSGWVNVYVRSEKGRMFMAVGAAHNASYAVGAIGGIVLIMWVWKERQNPDRTRRAQGDESTRSQPAAESAQISSDLTSSA